MGSFSQLFSKLVALVKVCGRLVVGLAFRINHVTAKDGSVKVGTLFAEIALFYFGLEGKGGFPHDGGGFEGVS